MTISAYQTLYESSIAFGMRKALEAEQGKGDMENKVTFLPLFYISFSIGLCYPPVIVIITSSPLSLILSCVSHLFSFFFLLSFLLFSFSCCRSHNWRMRKRSWRDKCKNSRQRLNLWRRGRTRDVDTRRRSMLRR